MPTFPCQAAFKHTNGKLSHVLVGGWASHVVNYQTTLQKQMYNAYFHTSVNNVEVPSITPQYLHSLLMRMRNLSIMCSRIGARIILFINAQMQAETKTGGNILC